MKTVVAVLFASVVTAHVHEERMKHIWEISNKTGIHWKAGANERFAHLPPGASKSLCGVKDGWKEQIREKIKSGEIEEYTASANLEFPSEFHSEVFWPHCAKIITDIRDQSNCGCCWAFAGAEAGSDRMCIATNAAVMLPLSAEDVCFCASDDGCQGGMVDIPWMHIRREGAVTGGQYHGTGPFGKGLCSNFELPHCHHHGPQGDDPFPPEGAPGCPSADSLQCPAQCDAEASAEHSDFQADKYSFEGRVASAEGERNIKAMIMQGGPVEAAFTVYSDFENYVSGIYHHVHGSEAGGHAIKITGWGTDGGVEYWKVANSWNPYWGEKGFFRIKRGVNEGGIEDQVVAASNSARWGKKSELTATENTLVV